VWEINDTIAYHNEIGIPDYFTTSTNGTLNMAFDQNTVIMLSGSASGYSVVLPNATQVLNGHKWEIYNTTNNTIALKDFGGTTLTTIGQNSVAYVILQSNSVSSGTWILWQVLISSVASGVVNYNLISSTPFTTSSTSDVVITGFTVTPQAGTYAIWYNASVFYTTTPIAHYWSIYKAGAQITDSARQQDTAHSNQTMVDSTMTITTVTGAQAIDIRVRRGTSGALTVNARSLLLIRLGT
jgi:hypothetical protein